MPLPGEHLAAHCELTQRPVVRAAGVVWSAPAKGLWEPLVPHVALDDELRNIRLMLEITGRRQARFAAAQAAPPVAWRSESAGPPPRAEVLPLAAWQVPDRAYAELVARHDAWSAVGIFEHGALLAHLVTCEDDGWVHEVACSSPAWRQDLLSYWHARLQRSGEAQGVLTKSPALGFTPLALGWASLRRSRLPY